MLKKISVAQNFSNSNEVTQEEFLSYIKETGCEVYTEDGIDKFKSDIRSLIEKGESDSLSEKELDSIEKAQKDLSHLTKKVIIDKNGKRKTVYVKVGEGKTEEHAKTKVLDIINSPTSKSDKVRKLYAVGIQDKGTLALFTDSNYSQVHSIVKRIEQSGSTESPQGRTNPVSQQTIQTLESSIIGSLPRPDVNEMWENYEDSARLVVRGPWKSLIAYGKGGVGKTYTVTKQLQEAGLREYVVGEEGISEQTFDEFDYVKITGKATPTAVWSALYQFNGKLIIFDDCDSALQHEDSQNILKGATDTSGDGTIAYKSVKIPGGDGEEKTPSRFKFKGKVIFISNVPANKMNQALKSRSLTLDMTMTKDETIERMDSLKQYLSYQDSTTGEDYPLSNEGKTAGLELLKEYKDKIHDDHFNTRTLLKLALTYDDAKREGKTVERWKRQALHLLG